MSNYFKKILKILRILIKARLTLKKPVKKKIIIFDKQSEIYISELFDKHEYVTLDTSYKEINIFILLKLILKFKKINYINYFHELIKNIKPEYIFTFIDNNLSFYKLKQKLKHIKFVSIQNGTRFITGDILEKLEKENKTYFVDHYFTFNECYAKTVGKYIRGNYKVIGSLKNNFFKIEKKYQKNSICYISRMSDIFLKYSSKVDIETIKKEHKEWEINLVNFVIDLLKNLDKYCQNKKLKLNILGSSKNYEIENNFFKNIFNHNSFNFIPKKNLYDSYKNIDKFEILINPMSTFGYEAISREKKVCFFSGDFIKGSSFIWPLNLEKKGNFFSNSNSFEEIKRVIDYLLKLDDKSWSKEISKYHKKLFFYDQNNLVIKKFLTDKGLTSKWSKD